MDKRLLVILSALGVAAVVAGLSAAATTSPGRSDSTPQPKRAQGVKPPTRATTTPTTTPSGVVSGAENKSPQNSQDTANYWTPERMQDAMPMGKTVPGGPDSSPRPSVNTVPASEPSRAAPARQPAMKKVPAKKTSAAGPNNGVTGAPATGTAGYWTQEQMDKAQPKDMTVPGGDGSAGSSDQGVRVVPSSAP